MAYPEQRYVTKYAPPDAAGRVIVRLQIDRASGPFRTWCEIGVPDLEAHAAGRGAEAWTVEDVIAVAGCVGQRA